ncbi:MAG: hypothetical protein ACPKM0_01470 [Pleomorphochaeta sp.]
MNINLILPFLLFLFSIIINLLIINSKMNNSKKNKDINKNLLSRIRNAEKNIDEKIIISEEKIVEQQNEVSKMIFQVDRKLQKLKTNGEEISKLTNVVERYRNMLGVLDVNTNETHDWVVKVRKESEDLSKLQDLIKEHQKETYKIIDTYDIAVEKQNTYYGDYEAKLEELRNGYIKEIDNYISIVEDKLNSKIHMLNTATTNLENIIQESSNMLNDLEKNQKDFQIENSEIKKEFINTISKYKENEINKYKEKIIELNNKNKDSLLLGIEKVGLNKVEEIEQSINQVIDSINDMANNSEKTKILNISEDIEDAEIVKNDKNDEKKKYEIVGEEEEIELE